MNAKTINDELTLKGLKVEEVDIAVNILNNSNKSIVRLGFSFNGPKYNFLMSLAYSKKLETSFIKKDGLIFFSFEKPITNYFKRDIKSGKGTVDLSFKLVQKEYLGLQYALFVIKSITYNPEE